MSSSPFVFPQGSGGQAIHTMAVQARREAKEIPASVNASLLPIIPRITTLTRKYARVTATLPHIWNSEALAVPGDGDDGQSIVFVSMDGTSSDNSNILTWQILRNGVVVASCWAQNPWDNLASRTPHQYGMWAGLADPGDLFTLRCGLGNGDIGTVGATDDVTFTLTAIHYRQQAGTQNTKETDDD